ncbi:MAG: ERCC4 domain-containing protein [Clostridiales bacterium]|nr:ERCC4 domain-containing protein [Clostridiales bacterium]
MIQIDSREQKNDHIISWFDSHGVPYIRSKMYVGDYQRVENGTVCIDKKYGLQEVYGCVVSGYDRFRAECVRAKNAGIHLIILVEEEKISSLDHVRDWENPRAARWERLMDAKKRGKLVREKVPEAPPVSSIRIENRMRTLSKRTGVEWMFCRKEDTARTILEVLHETY